jgi:N-glycosylase/DNA lyase
MEKDGKIPGSWLKSLPEKPREVVQQELVSLMGIGKNSTVQLENNVFLGRKVADCIALFSMNKLDVIPVDTHVWQIAQTYMPSLRKKKLNDAVYLEIGEFFRGLFGSYTGWAHTLLFAAELSFFKDPINGKIKEEIKLEIKEEVAPPKAISLRRKKQEEKPVKQTKRARKNKS